MSIVNLDLDMTVASIVEAMLPRFSDHKLGLLISLDLAFDDYGYGKDGNTLEREPQHARRFPWLLFVRPSNYTQVFFWEDIDPEVGFGNPMYDSANPTWLQTSNHDSCWRSDGFSPITDIYFKECKKFKGLPPKDVHNFNHFNDEPRYVVLETIKKSNTDDSDFSWEIKMKDINRDQIELIAWEEKNYRGDMQTFRSGWLIKGSEDHVRKRRGSS